MIGNKMCNAIYDNNLAEVKALITAGASVHEMKGDPDSPLERACQFGYREIALYLIEQGADTSKLSAFRWYQISEHEQAKKVLKNKEGIRNEDNGCFTPLMRAIYCGYNDIIAFLIENGADINHRSSTSGATTPNMKHMFTLGRSMTEYLRRQTPLMVAVSCGQIEAVNLLLKSKADMYLLDGEGQTALCRLINNNRRSCIQDSLLPLVTKTAIIDIFIENTYDLNFDMKSSEEYIGVLDLSSYNIKSYHCILDLALDQEPEIADYLYSKGARSYKEISFSQ